MLVDHFKFPWVFTLEPVLKYITKKSWNHNIYPTTMFLNFLLSWRKLFNVSFITKPKANKGIIIFNGLRLLSSILVLMFEEATNYQYCQCDQYWEDVSPSLKYSSHMSERIKRIAFTINNSIYLYFMVKKLVLLNKWTSKNVLRLITKNKLCIQRMFSCWWKK